MFALTQQASKESGAAGRSPKQPVDADGFDSTIKTPIQRRTCPCGGGCPRCLSLQRKLMIGAANDPLESEADAMAEHVMRGEGPVSHSGPDVVRRKCACEGSREHFRPEEEGELRRKPVGAVTAFEAPPIVHDVLSSPGEPLDAGTRMFMESSFGRDFRDVRVHTDFRAQESAKAISALAYTAGRDLVFGSGQYAPNSAVGRSLLAHELTHVLQQDGGAPRTVSKAPDKTGIKDSYYSYSNKCGWIDWGHANPGHAKKLIASVQQASDDLKTGATGPSVAIPAMAPKHYGVVPSSASMHVTLARPLTPDEVLAVSLSIFQNESVIFEIQQEWTDRPFRSAFSQEDLPSNIISFYRAARDFKRHDIEKYCDSQDVDASLKEYDRNSDFKKNRTFSPVGASGSWPAELSTIDVTKGESLYKVNSVFVGGPASGFTFCPVYRVVGRIGDTDLFILSLGGAAFTDADDVRVVPTYRVDTDSVSGSGHFPTLQVIPYRQSDADAFNAKKIKAPLFVSSSVLVCVGDIPGGEMAGYIHRKAESQESETAMAPQIVGDVLKTSGTPLDSETRAFMESRFGRDFSRVRVHTDAAAAESARSVNAHAYTADEHIVFGRGNYAPASREGQRLLAHELGHVVQHTGGYLRRDDPKPPVNKWDRIASEVFSRVSYDDYLATDLKSTTFFGQSLSNLHDDAIQKLQKVETDLKAKHGSSYRPPSADSKLRKRAGMHGWGMAIDFDILRNPYVLNERGEGELDKELLPGYDHIADFMLGDSQSSLRKLKQGRQGFGNGTVSNVYDALKRESDAIKRYFALKDNDAELAKFIANEWPANHQGAASPNQDDIKKRMKEDYEVLGGKTDTGGKRATGGTKDHPLDRPFAPNSTGGKGDPATGFLNLPKEFVQAMTDAGFAWGAVDIVGEPGDVQHFDLRLSGTGATVNGLMSKYK